MSATPWPENMEGMLPSPPISIIEDPFLSAFAVTRVDRSLTRSATIWPPGSVLCRLMETCCPTAKSVGAAKRNPEVTIWTLSAWAKSTSKGVWGETEYCTVTGSPIFNPVPVAEMLSATMLNCSDPAFVLVIIPSTSASLLSASSKRTFRARIVPFD